MSLIANESANTLTAFDKLIFALLLALVVFGLLAASHHWAGVNSEAGNPAGTWVGLVNVRFPGTGETHPHRWRELETRCYG